ncbi:MAG: response regulator, partial [Candidatus Omnitrophica bacterium]|nr:response regulator [Candidatus Omnitrophota bacterium]
KILIVDDEKDMVRVIELNLKDKGYNVVSAYSGEEALQKVESEQPDLVLLDVIMGEDSDGFGVCRKIKDFAPQCKVVIYTGKLDGVDVPKAKQSGADDFTVKTEDMVHLINTIERLL